MEDYTEYLKIEENPEPEYAQGWMKVWSSPDGTMCIAEWNKNKPSWRKTRLHGLDMVALFHKDKSYWLRRRSCCPAEFWHSDDYEAIVGSQPRRTKRRIQMLIPDGWLTLEVSEDTGEYELYLAPNKI